MTWYRKYIGKSKLSIQMQVKIVQPFCSCSAELILGLWKPNCKSYNFSMLRQRKWLETFFVDHMGPCVLQSQYYGYWWPGVSHKVVDLVLFKCSGFSTTKIKKSLHLPLLGQNIVCWLQNSFYSSSTWYVNYIPKTRWNVHCVRFSLNSLIFCLIIPLAYRTMRCYILRSGRFGNPVSGIANFAYARNYGLM